MATVAETNLLDVETAAPQTKKRRRPYLLDVTTYERMIKAGVFPPKNRIFLWNGRLLEKTTKNNPHIYAQERIVELVRAALPPGWFTEQDQPLILGEKSLPEPDLKVVKGARKDFLNQRPQASDISLVVEVSDSSLPLDTRSVLQNYARAKIPVYWIVNIPDARIEVYSDPTGPDRKPAYRSRRDYGLEEEVPVILDGLEAGKVAVKDVMP